MTHCLEILWTSNEKSKTQFELLKDDELDAAHAGASLCADKDEQRTLASQRGSIEIDALGGDAESTNIVTAGGGTDI